MVISELFQAAKRFETEIEWLSTAKFFEKVDSTQKRIQQFLPKGDDAKPVLIVAEAQTKGVGRLERPWNSPPGGIWFTLAFPMQNREITQVASFSVVAAYAVVSALKEVNDLKCEMKWPNDILFEGKKLGGILSTTTKKFRRPWFLIGVGINVNNELPADLKPIATTIKEIRGQSQGRSRLIEAIVDALWHAWEDYDRTGFGPYHSKIQDILWGKGKTASISAGKKKFEGKIDGIDTQGALLLKSGAGNEVITAGEIVGQPT